ncbi:hypothetical protein DW776_09310 [Ruminococcus sp. AM30-15AC]|nr:hypothetical protein DW776_09310 [Ruminococcus sp. AM30-15AC]
MNNTIFDDVFRTMVEKIPRLVIPLINEVFHTSYPEDVEITQLRNEHQQADGEVITDSCLLIGKKMYHIECQSTDDTTMAVRMIEYDFAIAIEYAAKQGRRYEIEFPRSCVLFLRSSGNTPDFLETNVIFPDGRKQMYRVPTVKMADYTAESIFEKNLLMLLPFYIMRYEKRAHDMRENPRLFQTLLNEYEEIRVKLEKELIKLIVKISDYIFQDEEKIQKGIGDAMGGKVLELESERLRAEGEARGKAIGESTGEARGKAIGESIGKAIGEVRGEERLSVLINKLILDKRNDEIQIVVTDAKKRRQYYDEYGL